MNVDGGKNASSAILIFRLSGIRWDFETGAVYMFRNLFFVQRSLFEFCFYSEKNFKNGLARGAHLPPDDQSKPIKHSNSSTSHKLALANQIPINYHYTSYFISNWDNKEEIKWRKKASSDPVNIMSSTYNNEVRTLGKEWRENMEGSDFEHLNPNSNK